MAIENNANNDQNQNGQNNGNDTMAGGNQDSNQNAGGNNAGQDDDMLAGFWDEIEDEAAQSNQSQQNQNGGQQNQQNQQGNGIDQIINALQFGDAMNDDIAAAMNEGDYSKFNEGMVKMQRDAARNMLQINGQLLQAFGDQLLGQVKNLLQGTLTERDNSSYMDEQFPGLNPETKGLVANLFNQAMTRTKGDRVKAADLTRKMMTKVGIQAGGKSSSNQQPGSNTGGNQTDWAKELGLSR